MQGGGYEYVSAGGIASATIISSGGTEIVSSGGTAIGTVVDRGGTLIVLPGGSATGTINSRGTVSSAAIPVDPVALATAPYGGSAASYLPVTYSGPVFQLAESGANDDGTPCYCRGTLILTDRGDVAVEDLRIGDRLVRWTGVARPIVWIGQRSYAGGFAARNRRVLPVLIRAGALDEGVPKRDLYVSPLHAMYVDGLLIAAWDLINGDSLKQVTAVEEVAYFHLELDTHDVIFAEGAASETFVDDDSRGMFQNAAEYRRLYPDAVAAPAIYCAPRVEQGELLEAVRSRLEARSQTMPALDPPKQEGRTGGPSR